MMTQSATPNRLPSTPIVGGVSEASQIEGVSLCTFSIANPSYTREDIEVLVGDYLDCGPLSGEARAAELDRFVGETQDMIMLSDSVYAMAPTSLAVHPIQKIRFIPYPHARRKRFLAAYENRYSQNLNQSFSGT
jgi:hypothetical protein